VKQKQRLKVKRQLHRGYQHVLQLPLLTLHRLLLLLLLLAYWQQRWRGGELAMQSREVWRPCREILLPHRQQRWRQQMQRRDRRLRRERWREQRQV
jgi:hypothetical protein